MNNLNEKLFNKITDSLKEYFIDIKSVAKESFINDPELPYIMITISVMEKTIYQKIKEVFIKTNEN